MNSNTHNQTSDNLPLSTPSLPIPTHLVIHQLSTISNPSTVDFERLSQQYAQFFFSASVTLKVLFCLRRN